MKGTRARAYDILHKIESYVKTYDRADSPSVFLDAIENRII